MPNQIHRGEIVEKILRKGGISLAKLAAMLGISRNTLYHRFKNASLSYDFILELGQIIHYDFTIDFPEMQEKPDLANENPALQHGEDPSAALWRLENKYTQLLEKHTQLLEIVMSAIHTHALHELHQEIAKLLDKEEKV